MNQYVLRPYLKKKKKRSITFTDGSGTLLTRVEISYCNYDRNNLHKVKKHLINICPLIFYYWTFRNCKKSPDWSLFSPEGTAGPLPRTESEAHTKRRVSA